MSKTGLSGIDQKTYRRLSREYRARWGAGLYAAREDGVIVFGTPRCKEQDCRECCKARAWAIAEGLRWGEPTADYCPRRRLVWAVPIMHNSAVLGGLVAEISEDAVFAEPAVMDIRAACSDLRRLAEESNLTNEELLAVRRTQCEREQQRAEAIRAYKDHGLQDLRSVYLREEHALLSAIRKGERQEARAILNRILVAIHFHSGERLELLKSFCMELVIMMCRSAVEGGREAESLLGDNYALLIDLAGLRSEEELLVWLIGMLDRIMDTLQYEARPALELTLGAAMQHMRRHFAEDLTREQVAREADLSPSHFSRTFHKHFGRTYADMLNQLRIDRACELLARSGKELVLVSLECGFKDQSYFHRVFRRYTGQTPANYRKRHQLPRT